MKLLKPVDGSINLHDMKDGEIAQITRNGDNLSYIGAIVQRYKNILITLGGHSESSFPAIFYCLVGHTRVKILHPGTQLEV